MMDPHNKGNGKAVQWLRDHVNYPLDYCLIWPFTRTRGYGQLGYLGKNFYAHRFMCELAHGEPPSPEHQAAHLCGNGVEGCVNPKHLAWKTPSENQLDCRAHGTHAKSHHGTRGRLSDAEAHQIRLLKGVRLQREVAEQFQVSESTVSDIWLGRTHAHLSKVKNWTPEEDAKLREAISKNYTFKQMADHVGRSRASVEGRAYRLGLRSGRTIQGPPPHG